MKEWGGGGGVWLEGGGGAQTEANRLRLSFKVYQSQDSMEPVII